jgi:hypothetical protein
LRRFKRPEHGFGAVDGLPFGPQVLNPRANTCDKDFGTPHMASGAKQLDFHFDHGRETPAP